MMARLIVVLFEVSCLVPLLALSAAASNQCGDFTFRSLTPNMAITAAEHATISITATFNIFDYPGCKQKTVVVYITKNDSNPSFTRKHFCTVLLTNAKCVPSCSQRCRCVDGNNGIVFTKTVTRQDNGTWLWRTKVGGLYKEVYFVVTYPPRVTELSISRINKGVLITKPALTEETETLQVTCKWEKGHPDLLDPMKVQLLNMKGLTLIIAKRSDTRIQAEFIVGCEGAGHITCIVPGAGKNGTAELGVRNCSEISTDLSTSESIAGEIAPNTDNDFLENWMFTPIIVFVLNVFTFIMFVIIIGICVWNNREKARRNPREAVVLLSHNAIT